MIDLGHFALVVAWMMSAYGLLIGITGAVKKDSRIVNSAANSIYLCMLFSIVSLVCLAFDFLSHNYKNLYVWQHSNNEMHPLYLVSAIWGGMDGSMLLWAGIMSIFSGAVVYKKRFIERDLFAWLIPVISAATGFFLTVVTFLTNPFRVVPNSSILHDGKGLNPLLQNPSMIIHPPMLYAGFTGFVIPAAFCMAALISGKLGESWIRYTRRATLVAWSFLTVGIILGGNWAYIELGWGGFWAWDPVENASFLPWLTGTAFLHSVMVQEQRGMLKVWNVFLAVITYVLTIFGTFLTRSGIVQSVHAFAEADVGWVFLLYMGIILVLFATLVWMRRKELRPENSIESFFSREAAFLFNNLLFLGICFATFWGVMFPVFSEALFNEKSVVGPPFFNAVNVPLFAALIFLMGIGPLISWSKASKTAMIRLFAKPLIVGVLLTAILLILDPERPWAGICLGLSLFVTLTIFAEFHRGVKVRREFKDTGYVTGVLDLVKRRPRRYGGFIVHLGVCVMVLGITASSAYKTEKDIVLKVGEEAKVASYLIKLESMRQEQHSNYTALLADVSLSDAKTKNKLKALYPERRLYEGSGETTTEVEIRTTLWDDFYIAFAGLDLGSKGDHAKLDFNNASAVFKVFVNPLQVWLWFGSVITLLGSLILLCDGLIIGFKKPATEVDVVKDSSVTV